MNQASRKETATAAAPLSAGPLRIVIAEDNEDLRMVMPPLINETDDLFCAGATDRLAEVPELIRAHDAQMVILDIELPDGSALKHLPALRTQFPATRFVIHSGHSNPELMRHAREAGAAGYILKTGDFDHLYAEIRRLRDL